MKEDEKGSVVEFPVHKSTLSKASKNISADKDRKVSFELERSKVLVSASFFSIVLAVSVANFSLDRGAENVKKNERGIASLGVVKSPQSVQWRNQLVRDLSESKVRPLARRGTRPSILDKLTLGTLGGAYTLEMRAGTLERIEMKADRKVESRSFDARDFFAEYNSLFPSFDEVAPSKRGIDGESVYPLLKGGKQQALVSVQLTKDGRLRSLVVKK